MKRTLTIFGAAAIVALLVVVGLTQTGMIDKNKPITSVPAGAVPHGGAEKPVSELAPRPEGTSQIFAERALTPAYPHEQRDP
jgi:hypothetical protein